MATTNNDMNAKRRMLTAAKQLLRELPNGDAPGYGRNLTDIMHEYGLLSTMTASKLDLLAYKRRYTVKEFVSLTPQELMREDMRDEGLRFGKKVAAKIEHLLGYLRGRLIYPEKLPALSETETLELENKASAYMKMFSIPPSKKALIANTVVNAFRIKPEIQARAIAFLGKKNELDEEAANSEQNAIFSLIPNIPNDLLDRGISIERLTTVEPRELKHWRTFGPMRAVLIYDIFHGLTASTKLETAPSDLELAEKRLNEAKVLLRKNNMEDASNTLEKVLAELRVKQIIIKQIYDNQTQ